MASPDGLVHSPPSDGRSPHGVKKSKRKERTRVTRACDRCKKRKIKCNGTQPCEFCTRASVNCTFESAYARGRAPSIVLASASDVGNFASTTQHMNLDATNHLDSRMSLPDQESSSGYIPPVAAKYVEASMANSPEPSQTDVQGHYIGPSSGVSFLLRVQKRLEQAVSFSHSSSIFTHGDAPLHPPEFDPSFCMMLPREDSQKLIDRYFDFAMPTYRFLHRPTIQQWFQEFCDTLGAMHDPSTAAAKVALLFMVFAHGRVYMPDDDRPGPSDLSVRYFLAAEHQLTREKGAVRLISVQARLSQCYYLLTQSRINHCWNLFGTVTHLGFAIGLNRNRRVDASNGGHLELELRRRTFWCAYTLDAYLSAALGRPRSFHDEDIDADLPACIEDDDLQPNQTSPPISRSGLSIMLAPVAHIKLARIVSEILRSLYSIRSITTARRVQLTQEISRSLADWRIDLTRFLDADIFSSSFVIPIFQRQRNVLNLTYWHAVLLTHRPFLLGSFAKRSQQDDNARAEDPQTRESIEQCIKAAMTIANTIDDISQKRQMFRAFWITAYFAFTANIVLYLYVIQRRSSPPEVLNPYYSAAARCQAHISAIAEQGSLAERYSLVSEELRLEAQRQLVRNQQPTAFSNEVVGTVDHGAWPVTQNPLGNTQPSMQDLQNFMPDSSIALGDDPGTALSDYSDWDHFASMVTSGFGNLDSFFNDGSFTF